MQITIAELSERWKVSKAKIYRDISNGKLSRLENGLIDVSEVLRAYGEAGSLPKPMRKSNVSTNETEKSEKEKSEKEKLLLERIKALEAQLQEGKQREDWLRGKLDQKDEQIKLLEFKQSSPIQPPPPLQVQKTRKGLLARMLGAAFNE